jgi:ABC-type sugar transport system ATPase subunit
MAPPVVEVRDVSKRYGATVALEAVSLSVGRGEIHALVGENGAGKSTLGKILAGAVAPDAGQVLLDGEPVHHRTPRDALRAGVALMHQEIVLVSHLTVLENVFLGAERARAGVFADGPLRVRARQLMEETGFELDPDARVGDLTVADGKKVELLRALARDVRVLILDEPTAALSAPESDSLHAVVRRLRERGTTIIYISHFLAEVLALADTVSVLKDGRLVQTTPAATQTPDTLITAMLGRSLDATFPDKRPVAADAPIVLRASGLARRGAIEDMSLTIRAGEIVGLAGLVGSGRTEVARAIFGADARDAGTIEVNGAAVRIRRPSDAIRHGIALLPESRKEQGLVLDASVHDNLTLPHLAGLARGGVLARRRARTQARDTIERTGIKTASADSPVATLSGGNQQKVALGKWLLRPPAVLIADEPTHGVDVGAKRAIYDLICSLAADGMAVLLISSELEEVMALAHRILVMHQGRLAAELPGDAGEDEILTAAFGAVAA